MVVEPASAVMVTSTGSPSLRLTLPPLSLVSVFSIRTSLYRSWGLSKAICTVSGSFGDSDGMILSTFPGSVILGFSGIFWNDLSSNVSLTPRRKLSVSDHLSMMPVMEGDEQAPPD